MAKTAYETKTRTPEEGEAEKPRRYTIMTEAGYEITVIRLTEDDLRRNLREFEAKYGMTSKEFVKRWSAGELDCAVMDYFRWEAYCDSLARVYGEEDLRFEYPPGTALEIE